MEPLFRRVLAAPQASHAPDRGKPLACGICHAGVLKLAPCAQEPDGAVLSPDAGPLVSPHSQVKGKHIKPARREEMNQIQTLIDAGREALTSNGIHDTILAVGIAAIPILIFCVIVNRLRHPDRSFLAALAVSVLGFFLVPSVATATAILWVYTGGAGGQAIGVGILLYILGFWMFSRWLRSAPRSARRPRALAQQPG